MCKDNFKTTIRLFDSVDEDLFNLNPYIETTIIFESYDQLNLFITQIEYFMANIASITEESNSKMIMNISYGCIGSSKLFQSYKYVTDLKRYITEIYNKTINGEYGASN